MHERFLNGLVFCLVLFVLWLGGRGGVVMEEEEKQWTGGMGWPHPRLIRILSLAVLCHSFCVAAVSRLFTMSY